MSLEAYKKTQANSEDPRQTEYRLFGQVTGALIKAKELGHAGPQLMDALHWNKRVWSTLASDCAVQGNQLPQQLRAGIISLSIFVGKQTGLIMRGEADIDDLIEINKTIMEGLAQQPGQVAEPDNEQNDAGVDDNSDEKSPSVKFPSGGLVG